MTSILPNGNSDSGSCSPLSLTLHSAGTGARPTSITLRELISALANGQWAGLLGTSNGSNSALPQLQFDRTADGKDSGLKAYTSPVATTPPAFITDPQVLASFTTNGGQNRVVVLRAGTVAVVEARHGLDLTPADRIAVTHDPAAWLHGTSLPLPVSSEHNLAPNPAITVPEKPAEPSPSSPPSFSYAETNPTTSWGPHLPPNLKSDPAEQGVIACSLLDNGLTLARARKEGITADSFVFPINRAAFEAFDRLEKAGTSISFNSLLTEVAGKQSAAANLAMLAFDDQQKYPTTLDAGHYIKTVRELELARRFLQGTDTMVEMVKQGVDFPRLYAHAEWLLKPLASRTHHTGQNIHFEEGKVFLQGPAVFPPQIIAGVLYNGGMLLLSGASKSMKSFLLVHLGLAIAAGVDWLGFKTTPTPVLYLNLELIPADLKDRMQKIQRALSISKCPPNFYVCNLRGIKITPDFLPSHLQPQIDKVKRETGQQPFVIIDPHYRLSAAFGQIENSNEGQAALLESLQQACGEAGLAIAAHFSKGDQSQKNAIDRTAGAGALQRFPDALITLTWLTKEQTEHGVSVDMTLRSFPPVKTFAMKFEYPLWVRDGNLDPSQLATPGAKADPKRASDKLLALLNGGPMSRGDWRDKAIEAGWGKTKFYADSKTLIEGKNPRVIDESGLFRRIT